MIQTGDLPVQFFVEAQIDSAKRAFTEDSIETVTALLLDSDGVDGDIVTVEDGLH